MDETKGVFSISKEVLVIVGSGIGVGLIAAIVALLKDFRKWMLAKLTGMFHKHYPDKNDVEQNREIYTELVEVRALTDADRSYVLRFHNGSEFLPSSPVWKITCTHEVVKHGVTYESAQLQSILVSRMTQLVEPVITGSTTTSGLSVVECPECPFQHKCLKENKRVVVVQVSDLASSYVRFHLESQNIKTMLLTGMVKGGNVFGIIGLDFCGTKIMDKNILRETATKLCRTGERIQYILQFKSLPNDARIQPENIP